MAPLVVPLDTPHVHPPIVQPLPTYRSRQPPRVVHVPTPVLDIEVIPDAHSLPHPPLSYLTLDIPIAIWKGIHHTRNPSHHYIGLSYLLFCMILICLRCLLFLFLYL